MIITNVFHWDRLGSKLCERDYHKWYVLYFEFLGLLKTIVDTFTENDVPDIMIVPIGISYDRVIEDMLFSCEVLGIPKPPESTKVFWV